MSPSGRCAGWVRYHICLRQAVTPTAKWPSTTRIRPLLTVGDLKRLRSRQNSSKSFSAFSKALNMSSIATSSAQTAIDAAHPAAAPAVKGDQGARLKHINKDPFAPSTTVTPYTRPSDSTRDVTHPPLPELFNPSFLDLLIPKPVPKKDAPSVPKNAFMTALAAEANKQHTQNMAHAFASTGSPLVDAFNGLSQATAPKDFEPLLRNAWEVDPLATLKIIFNLRSIHEGKSDREGFYRAWGWLYRNHPRTAILNLPALVDPLIERKLKVKERQDKEGDADEDDMVLVDADDGEAEQQQKTIRGMSHGYWKDPLNLLILVAAGDLDSATNDLSAIHVGRTPRSGNRRVRTHRTKRGRQTEAKPSNEVVSAAALEHNARISATAKVKRAKAHEDFRKNIEKLLGNSKPFRALYIAVARLFADALETDIDILKRIADKQTPDSERIDLSFQFSFAAKYAPSLSKAHDRRTNIASAIAELLWERGVLPIPYQQASAPSLEKAHDLREAYIRWAVSPIRRFQQIPEIFMSSNRWNELPYNLVASKCMQNNKGHFQTHDAERFSTYLLDVATGKKTISGGTLLPHSLLIEALSSDSDVDKQVIEAQWKTMVEKLRESGALDNCLAVCDVSGSMGYLGPRHRALGNLVEPIYPAVALSIVLSQVARPPWANSFITFSATPEIVTIDPADGMLKTAKKMAQASWGMNTDFNAVFTKLILPMAINNKLPKEEMIKRLFVFSDMEFDMSAHFEGEDSSGYDDSGKFKVDKWTTEHEKIAKAFNEAGYDVPEIVYWNLQGASGAKPVLHDWKGVGVMSGFSSNMLKTFMETGDIAEEEDDVEMVEEEGEDGQVVVKKKEKKPMTPEDVMNKALNKPSFATLKVED